MKQDHFNYLMLGAVGILTVWFFRDQYKQLQEAAKNKSTGTPVNFGVRG